MVKLRRFNDKPCMKNHGFAAFSIELKMLCSVFEVVGLYDTRR